MYKKITLLIGNGFDKSCDLKSAYTDMYEGYISSESKSPTIEKFKEELDTDITTWADFEMAMCSYMKSFSNEKEFLECLHDFRDYLTGHLEAEEAKFEKKLGRRLLKKCQEEIRDSFRTIQNYAFPEGERYTTVFSAICFNYTKVADMVFNSYNLNVAKIVHVHGTLDDSPVMGINDPAQFGADIPYPITADIITEYVKPSFNREYDRKRDEAALNMIKESDAICVFGMSLGDSDKRWIEALAKWVGEDSTRRLIYYDYNCCSKEEHGAIKLNKVRKTKRKLIEKLGNIDSDQIIIPYKEKVFDFPFFSNEIRNKKKERVYPLVMGGMALLGFAGMIGLLATAGIGQVEKTPSPWIWLWLVVTVISIAGFISCLIVYSEDNSDDK